MIQRFLIALTLIAAAGCDTRAPTIASAGTPAVSITKVSGDQQSGIVSEPLGQALVVRVLTLSGEPSVDAEVQWNPPAGGAMSPARSRTDASGHAASTLTLGPAVGTQQAFALTAGGPQPVTFVATAVTR